MDFLQRRKDYDPQNFYQVLVDFPLQFQKAYEYVDNSGCHLDLPQDNALSKVLVCGMGGSSLPTDIINNLVFDDCFLHVCRDYDVPDWVDEDTLIFVNSYSGNTEETLDALEMIRKKTKYIVIITAGGILEAKANEYNIPYYTIPLGQQPRAMTGYFIVYMLHVLFEYGFIEDMKSKMLSLISRLQEYDYHTQAQDIVERIANKLPIIYTSDRCSSVARIWKIKINENAKTQCFWNVFPELNHNEMVGFTALRVEPFFILLKSDLDNERVQKRMQIFSDILSQKSYIYQVQMKGDSLLEQIFSALLLGDWVSYYLALSQQVDPTPVDMVEDFKQRMK